jgi:hypothetical protein
MTHEPQKSVLEELEVAKAYSAWEEARGKLVEINKLATQAARTTHALREEYLAKVKEFERKRALNYGERK